ncbi:S8 family serine peptidase [Methylohalobius crimeensis]|uniref:S8 family serine peptidase n=1 Tax=Methylohalobius crimeensis TaxID=244365 RepID=UPI0003B51C83|nr:S8 family serine peptidase [Methylohalobius crimeensis]
MSFSHPSVILTAIWILAIFFNIPIQAKDSRNSSTISSPAYSTSHRWIWYDGNQRRTFWLASSEIAVFSKTRHIQPEEWPRLIQVFPDASLIEANELYARIHLSKPLIRKEFDRLLKQSPSSEIERIAPVFHPSPETRKWGFVLLPEVIVQFTSSKSAKEVKRWGKNYDLSLKRKLLPNNTFLFSCTGLDCIRKSRQIYEQDSSVRYAYPNWLRPRQTRLVFNADLQIEKTATPKIAVQGQPLTYLITIKNNGPDTARNIHITDTLPSSTTFISATASNGFCSGSVTVECTIGFLKNGGTATISLQVIPTASKEITNTAQISAIGNDPNPANNAATITTSVPPGEDNDEASWNDPLFQDQWHLDNTGQGGGMPGADIHITPAWAEGLTGEGTQITIVDDGLEINHEDLKANTASAPHYDYVGNDGDPTAGKHGTAVAGIAAANGDNGLGIVGTAPNADLIGLRLLGATSDTNEAAALNYRPDIVDLSNNSWGPPDGGELLAGPGPLTETAIADGATNGRNGKGIVYCWAGGNGGDNDNSNYDGYANLRYTIAVAASTNEGTRAFYSEKGANLLVNTPSSGGTLAITSTDRSGFSGYDFGNYTDAFGGTSATSPLACGALALLLEANPNLSWRDVQHILATTAIQNDPQDPDWTENGAGYPINHQFGFGRIDIAAAVETARNWPLLGDEITLNENASPNIPIPDDNPGGVSSHVEISQDIRVESAEVIFNADDHPQWGDLDIRLISPAGTVSVLAEQHDSGSNTSHYSNWRFTSVRHLGESSWGTWTLEVRDLASGNTGTFQAWRLNLYGSDSGAPPPPTEEADLSMTLTDEPDPASIGEILTYTATVVNHGPDAATGVTASLSLPSQLEPVEISTSQGNCTGEINTSCILGNIATGEQATITLITTPTNAGGISVSATATADQPDPIPDNNSATEATTVDSKQIGHLLAVRIIGTGRVISEPAGIDCPEDCMETYPANTFVTLTADPAAGKEVLWLGTCSGTQHTCSVEMTAKRSVTAWFR